MPGLARCHHLIQQPGELTGDLHSQDLENDQPIMTGSNTIR